MEKTNKKRILYVITQSEMGGAQRYLLELISHLNKDKYDITVAAGLGGDFLNRIQEITSKTPKNDVQKEKQENTDSCPEPERERMVQGRCKAQNCQIYRLKHLTRPINPVKDIKAYFELKTLINTIKPDILQLCSTKAGILGSLAARKHSRRISDKNNSLNIRNVKKNNSRKISETDSQRIREKENRFISEIIYRIGGWVFLEDIPQWKKWLYKTAEKYTSKFKDKIIVNCEAHRQLAIKLNIAPPEKIITIYNGIDLSKLTFLPREQARRKLFSSFKPQASSFAIGTIANFYKNKGLEYLIKAISIFHLPLAPYRSEATGSGSSIFHLLIIGDGQERQNLETLIRELKLESHVTLTGKLGNAHQYLKAFDIFILPSIKEGQPWSLMEAMAAELPIIATNIAAIPEMIENNRSGLIVEPKNPQVITEKIEYLIQNPKIAQQLGQNAKQVIKEKFCIEKMISETEKLY